MPNSFYIYRGIDNKGLYAIEDMDTEYITTSATLQLHFTGYAILFRSRAPTPVNPRNRINILSSAERSNVVDVSHDINARNVPFMNAGSSSYATTIQEYDHEENNPELRAKAREIIGQASTYREKAIKVFDWVNANIHYPPKERKYYNSKYYAIGTLHGREGNCCDQARLVTALLRSVGLGAGINNEGDVYFCHAQVRLQTGTVVGHVWPGGIFNGARVPFDTTTSGSTFGHNSFEPVSGIERLTYLHF
jgi:transglutaminase-like putative cysteine protease